MLYSDSICCAVVIWHQLLSMIISDWFILNLKYISEKISIWHILYQSIKIGVSFWMTKWKTVTDSILNLSTEYILTTVHCNNFWILFYWHKKLFPLLFFWDENCNGSALNWEISETKRFIREKLAKNMYLHALYAYLCIVE